MLTVLSCTSSEQKTNKGSVDTLSHTFLNKNNLDTLREMPFERVLNSQDVSNNILRLTILPGIDIHWNNNTSRIEVDSLFQRVQSRFENDKMAIANEIRNTAMTRAIGCPGRVSLRAGDISFLIIDKIRSFPLYTATHFQLDVLEAGCLYPYSLFEILQRHRAYMTTCVKNFLAEPAGK